MAKNKEQTTIDTNPQGFCSKCGRNFELNDIGTAEKPVYVLPTHNVIKGNGSKTVIVCKNSGGKAE